MEKKLDSRMTSRVVEVGIACLTICSGITTFLGALRLVSDNIAVAASFSIGIQLSMYGIGQAAAKAKPGISRMRLMIAWCIPAFFSIYSSAVGILDLQKAAIDGDRTREQIGLQWPKERRKIESLRVEGKAWLVKNWKEGRVRQSTLESCTALLEAIPTLSVMPPTDLDEMSQQLDAVFAAASSAYAQMPSSFRNSYPMPEPEILKLLESGSQIVFWQRLLNGDVRAMIAVVVAFLLDVGPCLVRYAHRPVDTLPRRLWDLRVWLRHLFAVFTKSRKPPKPRSPGAPLRKKRPAIDQVPAGDQIYWDLLRRIELHLKRFSAPQDSKTGPASGRKPYIH